MWIVYVRKMDYKRLAYQTQPNKSELKFDSISLKFNNNFLDHNNIKFMKSLITLILSWTQILYSYYKWIKSSLSLINNIKFKLWAYSLLITRLMILYQKCRAGKLHRVDPNSVEKDIIVTMYWSKINFNWVVKCLKNI